MKFNGAIWIVFLDDSSVQVRNRKLRRLPVHSNSYRFGSKPDTSTVLFLRGRYTVRPGFGKNFPLLSGLEECRPSEP